MRQRAADDVETINARLQELRKERERVIEGEQPVEPPSDTEPRMEDYACGFSGPKPILYYVGEALAAVARLHHEPGEHTDGA